MIIDPQNRTAMLFWAVVLFVFGVVLLLKSRDGKDPTEFWLGLSSTLTGIFVGIYVFKCLRR
ncbi:MAG TPA: hypothetical protein VNZ27_08255 [Rhodanobacter sp.]|jgi:hypothetical protein|nr:hypothetical protein [Rhodanobacter sp.]